MAKREMKPSVAKVLLSPAIATVELFENGSFKGRMYLDRKHLKSDLPSDEQVRKLFKEGYLFDIGEVTVELDTREVKPYVPVDVPTIFHDQEFE